MFIPLILLPVLRHMDGWGWFWIWRMGMFAFWIVLLIVIFGAYRRWGKHREPPGMERARAILAERLARGEISVEEYNERLGRLK